MKDSFINIYKYPDVEYSPHNTDAITEFNTLISEFGKTLQIDVFKDKYPELFIYLRYVGIRFLAILKLMSETSIYQGHVLNNLKFHFIDNTSLNAIAVSGNKYDHIGIALGSILNINIFFEILLSHPEILLELGNPSEEVKKIDDLSGISWISEYESIFHNLQKQSLSPKNLTPINRQRVSVANILSQIAIDFIILHELCHILYGHTTLNGMKNKPYIELGRAYKSEYEYEESQAIELHADGHSVYILLTLLLNLEREPSNDWNHKLFDSKEELLYIMFLSLNFLFYILDQNNTSIVDSEKQTHPHTFVRFLYAFETLKQFGNDLIAPEIVTDCWKRANNSMMETANILKIPTVFSSIDISQARKRLHFLGSEVLERIVPQLKFRIDK